MLNVEKEKEVIGLMIELYCKKKHKGNCMCNECRKLEEYAFLRIEKCARREEKTFCSNCRVHCYKVDMREHIKNVMRFSGPRMIWYHPIIAMNHVIQTIISKKRGK